MSLRRSPWGSPPWSLRVRIVRSLTRTRVGYRIKRLARRGQRVARTASYRVETRPSIYTRSSSSVHNVLLVSHADLAASSGLHVLAIATGLAKRGYSPVVAVPSRAPGGGAVSVVSHRDVLAGRLEFPNGDAPDLVHAFTP